MENAISSDERMGRPERRRAMAAKEADCALAAWGFKPHHHSDRSGSVRTRSWVILCWHGGCLAIGYAEIVDLTFVVVAGCRLCRRSGGRGQERAR